MKLSHLTLSSTLLSILPHQSASLKCGIKGITEPCIGDTDIRYNPDVSHDLKDKNDFWPLFEGLFIADECWFNPDGTILTNVFLRGLDAGLGTWSGCSNKSFLNVTLDGARFQWSNYVFAKHMGDGPEGIQLPGYINPIEFFGVSTFEKNANILQLGSFMGYPDEGKFTVDAENLATLIPIGSRAYMAILEESGGSYMFMYETSLCTDSACNNINNYAELLLPPNDDGVRKVLRYKRSSYTKVDKKTWMEGFSKAYVDYNIPPYDAPFTALPGLDSGYFVQPFDPTTSDATPECITLACPTEEDWRVRDPNFGTTPYIEPNGVLTDGFIAGVTIASITVALLIFYVVYKRGVENRERRIKEAVLKSIAKTMTLTTSKDLSPTDLAKMFQKIDSDENGNLDKNEVKGLVDEAGVANMSDRDYDVLFASFDLDGNGTLDFTEFCAFFASISIAETGTDRQFEDA